MRRLILFRHGEAERQSDTGADFDRALTERGREDSRRMGRWLAGQGWGVDLALVSPARRTRETWAAADLGEVRTEFPASFFAADPADMLTQAQASGAETVAVVGHNPGLQLLAVQLSALSPAHVRAALAGEFPKAGVAVAEARDRALTVVWLRRPSDLDGGA